MASYKRFEELPVWQAAAMLFEAIGAFIERAGREIRPSFRDQLERAALSVSNNIAEGFERGTTNELLAFIYIARGSAGEVRSMLLVAVRRPSLANLKSEISNLVTLAESCSRQLRAWADSLQNSDIAGSRHLNATTRASYDRERRAASDAADFDRLLATHLPPDHPMHPSKRPAH